ncbi:hypothetical protein DVH24_015765 [Malus domestica]|uniref:Uncharacterized protein n=1 Tax=Malus domestica TaxID=3750 RepID=A0A498HQL5_MALDO|nr:hypothetical protein DVH24_015765 [Malus domestica]
MEKVREKFQILKAEKISLEELKHVYQDSTIESESVKTGDKIVIAYDQEDIYWSSTTKEFSYYDNIVVKEDMDGFLGDDRVTNTMIDAHNYILRDQESNLDHQNFYFSINLFVSYKY